MKRKSKERKGAKKRPCQGWGRDPASGSPGRSVERRVRRAETAAPPTSPPPTPPPQAGHSQARLAAASEAPPRRPGSCRSKSTHHLPSPPPTSHLRCTKTLNLDPASHPAAPTPAPGRSACRRLPDAQGRTEPGGGGWAGARLPKRGRDLGRGAGPCPGSGQGAERTGVRTPGPGRSPSAPRRKWVLPWEGPQGRGTAEGGAAGQGSHGGGAASRRGRRTRCSPGPRRGHDLQCPPHLCSPARAPCPPVIGGDAPASLLRDSHHHFQPAFLPAPPGKCKLPVPMHRSLQCGLLNRREELGKGRTWSKICKNLRTRRGSARGQDRTGTREIWRFALFLLFWRLAVEKSHPPRAPPLLPGDKNPVDSVLP